MILNILNTKIKNRKIREIRKKKFRMLKVFKLNAFKACTSKRIETTFLLPKTEHLIYMHLI